MTGIAVYVYDLVRILLRGILIIVKYGQKQAVPPPLKNDILTLSATALALLIRTGKLTSQKVVETYIERIMEVQPYINGLAESRFDLAIEEAMRVDEFIASGKMTEQEMKREKPLLGVPFTVKLMFAVEGLSFNGSCQIFKDQKAVRDSDVVERVKRSGAILVGTSNMPEMGINPLAGGKMYGQAKNPHDLRMYPGVTSSGEAALSGAMAIPFGIANDLYGSIRIPALLCGVFGHRPTTGLLPKQTYFPDPPERMTRGVCAGPICSHAVDLVTTMQAILGPKAKELSIGESVDFSKLTIYCTHSFPKPSIVCSQVDVEVIWTIHQVANYFKEKFGTTVEYVDIDELTDAGEILSMDMKLGMDNTLVKSLVDSGKMAKLPLEILKSIFGMSPFSTMTLFTYLFLHFASPKLKSNYPKFKSRSDSLGKKLENLFRGQSVLFYPTFPKKYIYREECLTESLGINYCGIFTLYGLPATQCPTGFCAEGLPLGLQVLAGKNQDNLTLSVALEIEKGFGNITQFTSA